MQIKIQGSNFYYSNNTPVAGNRFDIERTGSMVQMIFINEGIAV